AKKREEEESRREEEEEAERRAREKRAAQDAAKTATDGTPRSVESGPGRSSKGKSRRSRPDPTHKPSSGHTASAAQAQASGARLEGSVESAPPTPRKGGGDGKLEPARPSRGSEARPAGTPIGRVELRRPPVSFDEPVSRAQRERRASAARERAESIAPPPS